MQIEIFFKDCVIILIIFNFKNDNKYLSHYSVSL